MNFKSLNLAALVVAAALLAPTQSVFAQGKGEVRPGVVEKNRDPSKRGVELTTDELVRTNKTLEDISKNGGNELVRALFEGETGKLMHIAADYGRGNGVNLGGAEGVEGRLFSQTQIVGAIKLMLSSPKGAAHAAEVVSLAKSFEATNKYNAQKTSQRYSPVQAGLLLAVTVEFASGGESDYLNGERLAIVYTDKHTVVDDKTKKTIPDVLNATGKTKIRDLHARIARKLFEANTHVVNGKLELKPEGQRIKFEDAVDQIVKEDDPTLTDPYKIAYKKKCLGFMPSI